MDVALERKRRGQARDAPEVSILVLVDVALELGTRRPVDTTSWTVSILVLVDVALELPLIGLSAAGCSGFNPCSRGCRS